MWSQHPQVHQLPRGLQGSWPPPRVTASTQVGTPCEPRGPTLQASQGCLLATWKGLLADSTLPQARELNDTGLGGPLGLLWTEFAGQPWFLR